MIKDKHLNSFTDPLTGRELELPINTRKDKAMTEQIDKAIKRMNQMSDEITALKDALRECNRILSLEQDDESSLRTQIQDAINIIKKSEELLK